MKKGDAIHYVANPIAKGIDAVLGTNASGCSGCKKMRENLNQGMSVADAIYERWFAAKQKGETMTYKITVTVDAGKMSDAVLKAESIGKVFSVQENPTPPTPQARPAVQQVPHMVQRAG